MTDINTDIVIIGGGIAGLWLHHRLNNMGYHAILIEKAQLGGGQTLSSQGIIHGGTKYTLNAALSGAASAIADMPQRWLDCLAGKGELDLSSVKLLSRNQLMWSTQGISSKLTSFLSSKALNGKMVPISSENYPAFFTHRSFTGKLYQLNEPVLDTHSLIETLSKRWRHRILHTHDKYTFTRTQHHIEELTIDNGLAIKAQEFVFAAGEGNEELLKSIGVQSAPMQRRPLQMVLAKSKTLPTLYAHCIGASTKPIATITSHRHTDGDNVWYIGGAVAEEGATMSSFPLINKTQKIIKKILPWANLEGIEWCTHSVNRAEPAQKNLLRPDTAFLSSENNLHVAWPTKLALAPDLSDKFISILDTTTAYIEDSKQKITDEQLRKLPSQFLTSVSPSLWDRCFSGKTSHG